MKRRWLNNFNYSAALRLVHSGREKDKPGCISQRTAVGINVDAAAGLLLHFYKRRGEWFLRRGWGLNDGQSNVHSFHVMGASYKCSKTHF